MPSALDIPKDYRAVVLTGPPVIDNSTLPLMLEASEELGVPDLRGPRILNLRQVVRIDSAAIANFINIFSRVTGFGDELVLCDPPPVAMSYFEIYGALPIVRDRTVFADEEGEYHSGRISYIPPFVPEPRGRIDIYEKGDVRSYVFDRGQLRRTGKVDFSKRIRPAAVSARTMAVREPSGGGELKAHAYLHTRFYDCGATDIHRVFEVVHRSNERLKQGGFGILDSEVLVRDGDHRCVIHIVRYKDREHYERVRDRIEADEQESGEYAPPACHRDEFHQVY